MVRMRKNWSSSDDGQPPHLAVVTLDLGGGEDAPHVVGGMAALVLAEIARVLVELRARQEPVLFRDPGFRVGRGHDRVGPGEDVGTIRFGDAHDVGDDVHRQLVGDVLHEVAGAHLGRRVEHTRGPRRDLLVEPLDHAGREARADQLAHPGVAGRIRRHQRVAALLVAGGGEAGAVERAEGAPVARQRLQLGVTEHHPELDALGAALERGARVAPDRMLVAQVAEQVVGEAAPVEVVDREVDVEDRRVARRGGAHPRQPTGPGCGAPADADRLRRWTASTT